MADTSDILAEEIAHLEELIGVWRQRLRLLDLQLAKVAGNPSAVTQVTFERDDVEKQLKAALAELRRLRPGPTADRSPYLGLLTFQESNADLDRGAIVRPEMVATMQQQIPQLRVAHIPGAGHSIRREQFDRYMTVIHSFLDTWAASY